MDPLLQYGWLLFLSLTVAATSILWLRDWVKAGADPARRRRETRRALAFLFWCGLPWAVMGLGVLWGAPRASNGFFDSRSGVFFYLWAGSIVAVWVALIYWLFAGGGAQELGESRQTWYLGLPLRNPTHIKLFFLACIVGGVIGLFILANWP